MATDQPEDRAKTAEWERDKAADIRDMTTPVRCAFCSRVYDLGAVQVVARYVDCSVWKTPCCNITADDRGETGWKSRKDYYPIDRSSDDLGRRTWP